MPRRRRKPGGRQASGPPMREGGGYPSGRESAPSSSFTSLATEPFFPIGSDVDATMQHSTAVLKTLSGASLSTWYSRDPFRATKTEAIILPYSKVNWGTFQVGTPAIADTVAVQLGARVLALFQQMVDVINYNGRFTPNQLITTAADWSNYLNHFTNAFTILWALLSSVEALDINASTRAFGTGVAAAGNLDQIAMAWRRLQLVPIPPAIPVYLASIFGVLYADKEDYVQIAYCDPNAAPALVTDWTLGTGAGSIAALIAQANVDITAMEGNTVEANLIQEVLSIVYGPPARFPKPCVTKNTCAFDMHFTRASVFLVATMFAQPGITSPGPGGSVPILIRKGMEADPVADLLATYLRPQFFDATGPAGSDGATDSIVGICTRPTTSRVLGDIMGRT
jgi:hypothetical protein